MSTLNTPTTEENPEIEVTDEIKARVFKSLQDNRYAGALGLSQWTKISQDVVQAALNQLVEEKRVVEGGIAIDPETPTAKIIKKSPGEGTHVIDGRLENSKLVITPNGVYYPVIDQAA